MKNIYVNILLEQTATSGDPMLEYASKLAQQLKEIPYVKLNLATFSKKNRMRILDNIGATKFKQGRLFQGKVQLNKAILTGIEDFGEKLAKDGTCDPVLMLIITNKTDIPSQELLDTLGRQSYIYKWKIALIGNSEYGTSLGIPNHLLLEEPFGDGTLNTTLKLVEDYATYGDCGFVKP